MNNFSYGGNIFASVCAIIIGILSYFLVPAGPYRWIGLLITILSILGGVSTLIGTLYSPPGSIIVSDHTSFINLSQNLNDGNFGSTGLFWTTYVSGKGDTASPVAVLLNVALTNTT